MADSLQQPLSTHHQLTPLSLFKMRAALLLLAFMAVFVVASPSMEKRKKKAKRPIRPTALPAPSPPAAVDAPAADAAAIPF
ncbi:hypothetical protein EYR38_008323 [Pleurotus pulmonarius]|nr:hypothetical protein EYR38_008323 [Pleurotus pulmonarius]